MPKPARLPARVPARMGKGVICVLSLVLHILVSLSLCV